MKPKKVKKKLEFRKNLEQSTVKKVNVLNIPYTDLDTEPEKDDESPAIKILEHSMEPAQDFEVLTSKDEGETSRNNKSKKSQKIKELKDVITQQKVLESDKGKI
jgi:hypothetical protein